MNGLRMGGFSTGPEFALSRTGLYFGKKKPEKTPAKPEAEAPEIVWVNEKGEKPAYEGQGFLKKSLRSARNCFILLLAAIGGGQVYNTAVGDGRMPRLNALDTTSTVVQDKLNTNTTQHLVAQESVDPETYWQAMQPAMEILEEVSPEIAAWVRQKQDTQKIVYGQPMIGGDGPIAAYHPVFNNLYICQPFWEMKDGDKAAVLAHEYRHSRQNLPKMFSDRIAQLLSLKINEYPCHIEDEAYLYEKEFYQALGKDPKAIDFYLHERDLSHVD